MKKALILPCFIFRDTFHQIDSSVNGSEVTVTLNALHCTALRWGILISSASSSLILPIGSSVVCCAVSLFCSPSVYLCFCGSVVVCLCLNFSFCFPICAYLFVHLLDSPAYFQLKI